MNEYSTCRECGKDLPTDDLNDFMVCYVCDHFCVEECSKPCGVKVNACAHEGTMGTIDLDTEMVSCDECGYAEPADPDDIANHKSLRDTGKSIY